MNHGRISRNATITNPVLVIELLSVGFDLQLVNLYRGVNFPG
jgi:hypothetical protein